MGMKPKKAEKVRKLRNAHPDWSVNRIAKRVPCAPTYASKVLSGDREAAAQKTANRVLKTARVVEKKLRAVARRSKRPAGPITLDEMVAASKVVDKHFDGDAKGALAAVASVMLIQAELGPDLDRAGSAIGGVIAVRPQPETADA